AELEEFGQDVLACLVPAGAKTLDRWQVDRQVVLRKAQHARVLLGVVLHDRAVEQPQDNGVAVLFARQELPLARGNRQYLALAVGDAGENSKQSPAVILARIDAQCHAILESGELADLDRSAERARA